MEGPSIHPIGHVVRYFARASVASVRLSEPLRVGEMIYVRGYTTDFRQAVSSIQREHVAVDEARAGELIGIRVAQRCRPHDIVYKLQPAYDA